MGFGLKKSDIAQVIRETLGAGSNVDLKSIEDALQSIQYTHRIERSLNNSFNGLITNPAGVIERIDVDDYWNAAGITIPAGYRNLNICSRATFSYPILAFRAILPTLGDIAFIQIGFGASESPCPNLVFEQDAGRQIILIQSWPDSIITANFTALMPADYDTAMHTYSLKLCKHGLEGWVDGKFIGIILAGTDAPLIQGNPPYALYGFHSPIEASHTAWIYLDNLGGAAATFPLNPDANLFSIYDGDPLPPRKYALCNENTATEWNAQVVEAGTITSHLIPIWSYPNKTLYFQANGAGTLVIQIYVGGAWRTAQTIVIVANTLDIRALDMEAPVARMTFTPDAYPTTVNVGEAHLS